MLSGEEGMFDRKKGRIFGINLIDILVIIIVIFALFSYISKPDENVYRGNQMYSAIQTYQRLDSRGFLLESEITGTFLWDNSPFHQTGILLPSTAGRLRFRKSNGDIILVGGERAYIEDVAVSQISVKPLDRYLVVFYLDPLSFETYGDLISRLLEIKKDMEADHLFLDIEIAVDAHMTPSEREKIVNSLNLLYFVKDARISRIEPSGFTMNILKGEIGELASLQIPEANVATDRIRAYAGFDEEPSIVLQGEFHIISSEELI